MRLKAGPSWAIASAVALALTSVSAGAARAASTTLVVNEVIHGDGHRTSHEFVEIRNVSTEDQHADLFQLQWRSTSSAGVPGSSTNTFYTFPVGTIIPAGGFYLVVSSAYAEDPAHAGETHNGTYAVAPTLGGVISINGSVALLDAGGNKIDSVGWGTSQATHPNVETAPAPGFTAGSSIERQAGTEGLYDHDDNSLDFIVISPPTPTSTPYTPSTPVVTNVTLTPNRVEPGTTAVLTATVTKTVNDLTSVTVDLTPLGGASGTPLTNTSGTTWSTTVSIPANQPAGPQTLIVKATDNQGKYGTGGVGMFVYPGPPITVAEALQRTPAEPGTGELVRVRGVVTSVRSGFACISDAGANAGIAVTDGTAANGVEPLEPGQDVTITGRITREDWYSSNDPTKLIYRGEYRLETATGTADDVVVNSTGNTLPAPIPITVTDLLTDSTLVGKYVSLNGLTAKTAPSKVSGTTGDHVSLVPLLDADSTWIAVSRTATDKAATPFPGVGSDPIPATHDANFYLPWITAGDVFNVKGIVGITSVGINTTTGLVSPKVIRVRGASDFVLTNNAKFMYGGSMPSPAEQGHPVTLRVVGYPVGIAAVSANLAALGAGTRTLTDDGTGGYAVTITVPANAALGDVTIPVTVSHGGATAEGSFTITIAAPTTNPGDVDRSGGVPTVDDVRLAIKVAAGFVAAEDPTVSLDNGDVFPKAAPDGSLTLEDALRVLRAVNGKDTL